MIEEPPIGINVFPKYKCPIHGANIACLNVSFSDEWSKYNGNYCQICWVEKELVPNCQKVIEIKE